MTPLSEVEQAAAWSRELEGRDAAGVVRWAVEQFGEGLVIGSSFGKDGLVILDVARQLKPEIPVLFLETGYHFPETLEFRDLLRREWNANIVDVRPELSVPEQDAAFGFELFARDPDRCCAMRKVEPLQHALAGRAAWMTGVRRSQHAGRAQTPVVEWQELTRGGGLYKINPLVAWTLPRSRRTWTRTRSPATRSGRRGTGASAARRARLPSAPARGSAPDAGAAPARLSAVSTWSACGGAPRKASRPRPSRCGLKSPAGSARGPESIPNTYDDRTLRRALGRPGTVGRGPGPPRSGAGASPDRESPHRPTLRRREDRDRCLQPARGVHGLGDAGIGDPDGPPPERSSVVDPDPLPDPSRGLGNPGGSRGTGGRALGLLDPGGRLIAILHVEERFPIDPTALARATYGTEDPKHPNVADLLAGSTTAWGGRIDLVHRLLPPWDRAEPTPAETRTEFARRGWERVAGYQCRNPPHTAHEYIQRLTLEREDVDGLLIHPVVGRLKKGDYRPEVILEAYDALVRNYYPANRVMMTPLTITMRYGGPKAALFLAIVRRNYGCAVYIVGRDQAGVGKYDDPYACHRIFDAFDIGVPAGAVDQSFFCRRCGWMASGKTCAHPVSDRAETSQSRVRDALASGAELPPEILRPEVAAILRRPNVMLT